MFRRLPSGLPKDPVYPANLEGLGYFINENDEIRSIENPKAYFKFFLTKNDRYNCVQREAMNEVIRKEVCSRLEKLGLVRLNLPLGAIDTECHVPIYHSHSIHTKDRVIILFYEHTQDIGIFAHRILGSKGGIKAGSCINFVEHIQSLKSKDGKSVEGNDGSPGVILANMGQLHWWRRGKKAVTQTSWYALPQKYAVDNTYRFDAEKNTIPGNRNGGEHVNYMFNEVAALLLKPSAKIDIIGVADGAYQVSMFLNKSDNWEKWGNRLGSFAAICTYFQKGDFKNEAFAKWYKKRARAYLTSQDPEGVFIAGPEGNRSIVAYGCPAFSLGEPYYSECMLPKGYKTVVGFLQEAAAERDFENPEFTRLGDEEDDEEYEVAERFPEGQQGTELDLDYKLGRAEDAGTVDGEAKNEELREEPQQTDTQHGNDGTGHGGFTERRGMFLSEEEVRQFAMHRHFTIGGQDQDEAITAAAPAIRDGNREEIAKTTTQTSIEDQNEAILQAALAASKEAESDEQYQAILDAALAASKKLDGETVKDS